MIIYQGLIERSMAFYQIVVEKLILGNFACFIVVCWFFSKSTFFKILSGIPSECQTVRIHIRPDVLPGLIWVQTVCNGYQQKTLVGKELILEIFNDSSTVADNQFVLSTFLMLYLIVLSADSLCKHLGGRAWSGSNLFHTLISQLAKAKEKKMSVSGYMKL